MEKASQFTSDAPSRLHQLKSSASMAHKLGAEENDELLLWSVSQHRTKVDMLQMNLSNSFDYMLKSGSPSNITEDIFANSTEDILEQADAMQNSHLAAHEKWTHMYSRLMNDLKAILAPELVPVVHLQVSEESPTTGNHPTCILMVLLSLTSQGPSKVDMADMRGSEETIRSSDTTWPLRLSPDKTAVRAISKSRNSMKGDDEIRLAGSPSRGDSSIWTSNSSPPIQPLSRSFIIQEKDIPETNGRKIVITRSLTSRSPQTPFVAEFYSSSVAPLLE
jgi:hypothetical protein